MWFVDSHEMLVLVQQLDLEGHARLGRQAAPVPEHGVAGRAAGVGGEGPALGIEHIAARQAFTPGLAGWQTGIEKVSQRGPGPAADGHAAGADTGTRAGRPGGAGPGHAP